MADTPRSRPRRLRRWLLMAVALGVLVVAAGAFWFIFLNNRDAPPPLQLSPDTSAIVRSLVGR